MIDSRVFEDWRIHRPCPDALLYLSMHTGRPRTDCPQLLRKRIEAKDWISHAAMRSGTRELLNGFIEAQLKAERAGKWRPATGPGESSLFLQGLCDNFIA